MNSNFFIFHGTGGHPAENWFPWLKNELEKLGSSVIVPQFPTPEGQSFRAWMDVLRPNFDKINSDTVLIGHSLGGIFTLKLLETLRTPIKLAVFVGTPIGEGWVKNYAPDEAFAGFNFEWNKIKKASKNFIIYHSDNDPYVALENGQNLAMHLGVDLTFIANAGHFNSKTGYLKFDDLLKRLQNILK